MGPPVEYGFIVSEMLSRPVLLKLQQACELLDDLVKMQIMIQ